MDGEEVHRIPLIYLLSCLLSQVTELLSEKNELEQKLMESERAHEEKVGSK